jgi:hypothetical protein
MSKRWRPINEGIGPFSRLNLQLTILSTETAVKVLGEGRMPKYWDKEYYFKCARSNRLPDYNLDPPDEDEIPDHLTEEELMLDDYLEPPDNWEETCQMLGVIY